MHTIPEFIQDRIRKIPQGPGVYLMRGESGEIIYVGKANRLRSRIRSHFRDLKPNPPKAEAMIQAVHDIDFIPLRSEEEALILECQYIKEFKPKYNVTYRDDKNYPLLKVTLQEPFPRFIITRIRKPDGALYLGPYTDAAALRKTVEDLERIFRIRTCCPAQPGKKDYEHCLYQMMKWCSAPCVEKISKEEYRSSVESACQVLMGRSGDLIRDLNRQMENASLHLEFEKAAQIRDTLAALEKITGTRTRTIQKFKRIPGNKDHKDHEAETLAQALGLEKTPERIEAFDISNFAGKEAVGSMVHFFKGKPDKRFYRHFKIKGVVGIDDFAMMKEVVERRYRRLKEEGGLFPDLILIDGGKGQLSSARGVLQKIDLTSIPIIGLAKRYEEIYTPYGHEPIRLAHDSPALHLIQRVRDEAHRFAIAFHKRLREKKIRESILDDIPGLGQVSKENLLKTFGSLDKIRRASLDEIAQTEKISKRLAEKIYQFLHPAFSN
ncbi:MAG: excinuclease ABC subunit UvrC [Chlamydiae bacterium]|nr:excinuclease ABC subunit UvrC [Chlamydiota bacterium]MBI3277699.1 excinuclease ABC subunit UvrC [Chlamydiota bacterium]